MTSGLTRMPTRIGRRSRATILPSATSSAVDSTVARARSRPRTAAVSSSVRLPHPAEDDPLGLEAGREGPGQLAAGDDVGTGAEIAQDPEHGEVAFAFTA